MSRSLFDQHPTTPAREPVDPYAVPEHLRAAYGAASPDAHRYLEQAVSALVQERNPVTTFYTETMSRSVREKHLPEALRRAEHLSRLAQAWEAVEAPKLAAARDAEYAARFTCSICGEVSPDCQDRYLDRGNWAARFACRACEDVARAIWTERERTKHREKAVRAALNV
ncbi:hypothetical protein [Microbacterium sp. VKM Ac-2923]|uniref:hypothetical protein n=1 Tax=Microbacterium sp. VKM Ac-2923 TaxID=2929476 RepID=UPI001FB2BAFA|nr:hypothetical protein [Microbacterium sp. VKM Ac-2923]MCJ1707422.1 hypothetical protein [Microbacterium sp. VKM Ac-2923]